MGGAALSPSFQEAIDAVEALPPDDQAALIEIINKRLIQRRRSQMAAEAEETLEAYRRGEVRRGTIEDLMKDLED